VAYIGAKPHISANSGWFKNAFLTVHNQLAEIAQLRFPQVQQQIVWVKTFTLPPTIVAVTES